MFLNPTIVNKGTKSDWIVSVKREIKNSNCKVERIEFTSNNNIKVYPSSSESKQSLLKATNLFGGCKAIIDTANKAETSQQPMLLLKGVTFEEVFECFQIGELEKYGVANVVQWKTEIEGRQPRLVKLFFASFDLKQATLKGRVVYINCFAYRVEEMGGQPIQCRNCLQFGHKQAQCTSKSVCSRCGGEHERSSCAAASPICSNCGGKHSSTYKGCRIFKNALFRKNNIDYSAHQDAGGPSANQNETFGVNRLYSTAAKSNRPQNVGTSDLEAFIARAFAKQTEQLNLQIKSLESKINEVVVTAQEAAKSECQHFFNRLLFFVVDCIGIVAPNVALEQEFPNAISNAAIAHGLGNKTFDVRTYLEDKAQRKANADKIKTV